MAEYLVKTRHLVVNLSSTRELLRLAEVGTIGPSDLVREKGETNWLPAHQFPILAGKWSASQVADAVAQEQEKSSEVVPIDEDDIETAPPAPPAAPPSLKTVIGPPPEMMADAFIAAAMERRDDAPPPATEIDLPDLPDPLAALPGTEPDGDKGLFERLREETSTPPETSAPSADDKELDDITDDAVEIEDVPVALPGDEQTPPEHRAAPDPEQEEEDVVIKLQEEEDVVIKLQEEEDVVIKLQDEVSPASEGDAPLARDDDQSDDSPLEDDADLATSASDKRDNGDEERDDDHVDTAEDHSQTDKDPTDTADDHVDTDEDRAMPTEEESSKTAIPAVRAEDLAPSREDDHARRETRPPAAAQAPSELATPFKPPPPPVPLAAIPHMVLGIALLWIAVALYFLTAGEASSTILAAVSSFGFASLCVVGWLLSLQLRSR